MKKIAIYSALLSLLLVTCKKPKDLPEPEVNEPHFYINCNVDGKPLNIQAGNDNYYMNASWYYNDSDSLYVYKANLAKQTGAGYQITILLNNYKKTDPTVSMLPDSALWKGQHLYDDKNTSGQTQIIRFTPVKSNSSSSATFSWVVTDGTNTMQYPGGSNGANYYIESICDVGKTYTVDLNYSDGFGTCSADHWNVFKAGSNLQTTITAKRDTSYAELAYKFSYTNYYPGLTCRWDFPTQTSFSPSPTIIFIPGSTNNIKLTLTDGTSGETCVSYYQLNATSSPPSCDANFTAAFSKIRNLRDFSSVTILLTDPNGVVYSSGELVQPSSSIFQIDDLADYNANEKNQATKQLNVKFDCIVKSGNNEIHLTNGEAKIAVAYK